MLNFIQRTTTSLKKMNKKASMLTEQEVEGENEEEILNAVGTDENFKGKPVVEEMNQPEQHIIDNQALFFTLFKSIETTIINTDKLNRDIQRYFTDCGITLPSPMEKGVTLYISDVELILLYLKLKFG